VIERTADPERVAQRLQAAPRAPGVYFFKDARGMVIYVGKAANLRQRIGSYFHKGGDERPKVEIMLREIADIEWLVTDNEVEALFLEDVQIKRLQPRYNARLKDDKNYPYLRLDLREAFPRLTVVRRCQPDGARYFGPYYSARAMRLTMRVIHRHFHLRQCKREIGKRIERPCVYHQIGWCLAPCAGKIDREEYHRHVQEAVLLLQGRSGELVERLTRRMEQAAEALEFELAAGLRDSIRAIRQVTARQKIIDPAGGDADLIAIARGDEDDLAVVFHVREGRLIGRSRITMPRPLETGRPATLARFLVRYYAEGRLIPPLILLEELPEEPELLTAALRLRRGRRVELRVPRRGRKRRLLEMAVRDAATHVAFARRSYRADQALEELRELIGAREPPRRIECVDISNISGVFAVGSLAVFQDGRPERGAYRRYKVQLEGTIDDYAMLREVLRRRFARRNRAGWELPDLLVIDGGKGHLSVARELAAELDLQRPALAALAKIRGTRTREGLYLPHADKAIELAPGSPALRLLGRIRDEAHRLAVTYHRLLRSKAMKRSILEEIPGVGPKRSSELLRTLGSLSAVSKASVEELTAVHSIDRETARRIRRFFEGLPEATERA
jgi:excinuclease ABC subunit C